MGLRTPPAFCFRHLVGRFEKALSLSENLPEGFHEKQRTHAEKRLDVVGSKPGTFLDPFITGKPVAGFKHAVPVILNTRYEITIFDDPLPANAHATGRDWLACEVKV